MDQNDGRRYYPDDLEIKILQNNINEYFSYPDRSEKRNKLAREVSRSLKLISPHWSVRAVRLWYNNHRKNNLLAVKKIQPTSFSQHQGLYMHQMSIPQFIAMLNKQINSTNNLQFNHTNDLQFNHTNDLQFNHTNSLQINSANSLQINSASNSQFETDQQQINHTNNLQINPASNLQFETDQQQIFQHQIQPSFPNCVILNDNSIWK